MTNDFLLLHTAPALILSWLAGILGELSARYCLNANEERGHCPDFRANA